MTDTQTLVEYLWCDDPDLAEPVARFFVTHVDPSYISHSDIQTGRATTQDAWGPDLLSDMRRFARRATDNDSAPGHQKSVRLALAQSPAGLHGIAFLTLHHRSRSAYAVLEDLVIARDMRGKGIGRGLIDWISCQCRALGLTQIFLESAIANRAAHRMFECVGFETTSIVMRKSL